MPDRYAVAGVSLVVASVAAVVFVGPWLLAGLLPLALLAFLAVGP